MVRVLSGLVLMLGAGIADAADLKRIMVFEMDDQFGETHTHKELMGEIFMVMGADKEGSEFTKAWTQAIQLGLIEREDAEPVELVPAPQLGTVPRLLRGTVKKFVAKDATRWVLLDWESKFTKAYGMQAGKTNLLVFSAKGDLVRKVSETKLDQKIVEEIVDQIAELQAEDGE